MYHGYLKCSDDVREGENSDSRYLLMPGLIDAHTHMTSVYQIPQMLKSGVVATCDVCATSEFVANSKEFTVISSLGMTMGTLNGKGYVKNAIDALSFIENAPITENEKELIAYKNAEKLFKI